MWVPWVIRPAEAYFVCFPEIRKCNHCTIRASLKNFPLIINMLISLHGSSPSLPGGGKQLTRVMGAPWPQFGAVCSSSPLFWDELWNIVFLPWTRHLNCPLVYVLALF